MGCICSTSDRLPVTFSLDARHSGHRTCLRPSESMGGSQSKPIQDTKVFYNETPIQVRLRVFLFLLPLLLPLLAFSPVSSSSHKIL